MVPKFRTADLGTDFKPFCFAFLFYFEIRVSLLNEANNRARTDLLGQVWLHLVEFCTIVMRGQASKSMPW